MDKDKEKALELAVSQIERQFGKGSIMKLGEAHSRLFVESIPTGSIALDIALGIGGIPRGRVIEIYGPESSGKTTIVQHVIAECQRRGGVAALIDAEHALDPVYAAQHRRQHRRPVHLAAGHRRAGAGDLRGAGPERRGRHRGGRLGGGAGAARRARGRHGRRHVGLQARLMSQALRKLTGAISRSKTSVIFTNQLREKIGVMFGNPETTPGGRGAEVLRLGAAGRSADRLDQGRHGRRRQPDEGPGGQEQGRAAVQDRRVRHHVQRGHLEGGRPPRPRRRAGDRAEVGRVLLVRRTRLGQGRENAKDFLRKNVEIRDEIERQIRADADRAAWR